MLNEKQLNKLAAIQLQLAVLNGEKWAIQHVMGITPGLAIGDGDGGKWEVQITHVSREKDNAEEKEEGNRTESEGLVEGSEEEE